MSVKVQISAQVPANKEKGTPQLGPATITIETGETAAEMIKLFGDEAVKSNAQANWTVTLQNGIRAGLRKGESQESMQARLGNARMGMSVKGAVVDPEQAYQAKFLSATAEEQAAMIKRLQERMAKIKKG